MTILKATKRRIRAGILLSTALLLAVAGGTIVASAQPSNPDPAANDGREPSQRPEPADDNAVLTPSPADPVPPIEPTPTTQPVDLGDFTAEDLYAILATNREILDELEELQGKITDVRGQVDDIQMDLETMGAQLDGLVASDEQIINVEVCTDRTAALGSEVGTDVAVDGWAIAKTGLEALGTGALAKIDVEASWGLSHRYGGGAAFGLEVCADMRNLLQPSGANRAQAAADLTDDELADLLRQFWVDRGLLSLDGRLVGNEIDSLLAEIEDIDVSAPRDFFSADSALAAAAARSIPAPDAAAEVFSDPAAVLDELMVSASEQLNPCSPDGPQLPESISEFFANRLGDVDLCEARLSPSEVTELLDTLREIAELPGGADDLGSDFAIAYNELCDGINGYLSDVNATTVSSPGKTIDFGSTSVVTDVQKTTRTTRIAGQDVVTGVDITPTRATVGVGPKTVGEFSTTPFSSLPGSVCTPLE